MALAIMLRRGAYALARDGSRQDSVPAGWQNFRAFLLGSSFYSMRYEEEVVDSAKLFFEPVGSLQAMRHEKLNLC